MAKKKKSKLKLSPILAAASALLALVALLLIFAPAIVGKTFGTSYTGIETVFGKTKNNITILKFSFGNLVPYLLLLVGIVLAVLATLGKGGNLVAFLTAAAFVAAGVLLFCAVPMTAFNAGILAEETAKNYTLAAGTITGGVLSLLSGLLMLAKVFVKK